MKPLSFVTNPKTGGFHEVIRLMAINNERAWYAIRDSNSPNDFKEKYIMVEGESQVWTKEQYDLPVQRFDGFDSVDA